ncbi:MAG: 16S rRNA (cytosine(967)-C(5))-methyltransferase RsmB [Oscillospiraceae bacterium]|nr:16S rRNA (cytosine(967)-C(5))-methyltransferase RsmB [Oscillospiraceae bacterium]
MGARETALNALIACRKEGAWSNGVLKEYILRDRLDRRDAALATRLCYGVLQNRNKLDWYLQQLLTGKIKDLHPVIHDILHLGLYQIYELDKVPGSAAVNESVDLAKKYCKKQRFAPGLVNGVLRNAVQTKGALKEPKSLEDRYSHPWELIKLLRDYVGKDRIEMMLRANNDTPQTVVQVNTLKTTAEELIEILQTQQVSARPHDWMPDCLVLGGTGDLEKLPAFRDGLFYVQDAAAKLSVLCAELPQEEIRLLDCCAAPGGKSFAAAVATGGKAEQIACDVHPHKTGLIENGAKRLGFDRISVKCLDASVNVPEWNDSFDAVICDVPCSGFGIIRKKPDIRYKNPADMADLPDLQLRILKNQARYVKKGGVLIYSTCTLLRSENEGVVEAFLAENKEYCTEPLPLPAPFPKNESGMLALVPGEYDTDGFFICRLRRKA